MKYSQYFLPESVGHIESTAQSGRYPTTAKKPEAKAKKVFFIFSHTVRGKNEKTFIKSLTPDLQFFESRTNFSPYIYQYLMSGKELGKIKFFKNN